MTTVHAYTNDQVVQDFPHSDPYRARAAAVNIIPDIDRRSEGRGRGDSGAQGQADGHFAPRAGHDGQRGRSDGRHVEATCTKEEVNAAMKKAAEGPLKGILCYTEDPIVSSDIIGDPHSSIFAADFTQVLGGNLLKVVSWYDNEWGYSCRTVDLIAQIGKFK